MRKSFVILLMLAAAGAAFGQLSGPLSGILGPGTFTVIGNIRVDTSQTLTILPPTTLDFQGPFPFDIYGVLTALGTPVQPIVFTTSTQTGTNRWRGLRFQAQISSGSSLAHCIIEKGYALGASMQDNSGGGIFCLQSSPRFAHCLIQNNFAFANGGGVYCESSRAIFDTCTITADTAQSFHPSNWWGGGGVLCVYGSETFTGCTITQNVTLQGNGGGAWIELDTASFVDCDISYNLAQSLDGGGVYTFWHAIPTFTNCGIYYNTANRDGGGIHCDNTSAPTYAFCTLSDNAAGQWGGGAYCQDSPPPCGPILNSTIIAFSSGEGMFFANSSGSAISYCDFFGNSAGDFGGAVPPFLGLIMGTNANGDPCDAFNNIFGDPWFVGTPWDLHLLPASRCLGAADPAGPPLSDFEGGPRPDPPLSLPDIGMDESPNAQPSPDLSGPLSGTLGPGYFRVAGNIRVDTSASLTIFPPTTLDFQDSFSFKIYGTLMAIGNPSNGIRFTTNRTGTNRWRGLRFLGPVSSNSQLAYCLIEKGYATGPSVADMCGGGVYCYQSSPHLAHCQVQCNYADACGGGVYCEYSRAIFDTCVITGDTTLSSHPSNYWGGGGVACVYGAESFTSCIIHWNMCQAGNGGGVWIKTDTASFTDCAITNNWTLSLDGGGVYCFWDALPTFTNCNFSCNQAARDGGGTWCDNTSTPTYAFCTLSDNTAGGLGGGAYCQDSPPPNGPIFNSTIIAFSTGEGMYFVNSSGSAISYCDFFGNSAGDFGGMVPPGLGIISGLNANGDPCDVFTNISLDPQFVNHVGNDFHIVAASRCIGAADPLNPPLTDFEGQQRPDPPGSNPDIGMDENLNATPTSCINISGSLTGTLGPGLYCVTGDIWVPPWSLLTLQPGTTFDFQGPFSFRILGQLIAVGTAGNPILFTTILTSSANRWRGLRFGVHPTCGGQLSYCTIENGYATGSSVLDSCGGAVFCRAPVTFSHCTIRNSAADLYGGGVCCMNCSPTFTQCNIYSNWSTSWPAGAGGGVYVRYSTATFDTCLINGNWARSGGGILCDTAASPTLRHCQITGNSAGWDAGGVYCDTLSAAVFDTCSILSNTATNGGGVYCRLSSPSFTGSQIAFNTATSLWGGVICGDRSSPTFTNCDISNNTGATLGGGVWCWQSTPSLTNCLIASNSATTGGGVGCDWNSSPVVRHCTVYNNTATTGAGVYVWGSSPTINSTIVAFSNGQGVYFEASAASQVSYCDIFGNTGGDITFFNNDPTQGPAGIGQLTMTNANGDPCDNYWNILLNPLFLNVPAGDFHLTDYSHCLGAGDNNGLVVTDFEGQSRPAPAGSNPDIGMDEHFLAGPVRNLVITMVSGNAVLYWPSFASSYNIYGATAPYTTGTQLAAGVIGTTWTDTNTPSRPSPYFYYVTGQ